MASFDELYRIYSSGGWNFPFGNSDYDYYDKIGAFGLYDSLLKGESNDYLGLQGMIGMGPVAGSAEFEKWLDNMIANQNTQAAREWDERMRDTSYLSAASQLAQLGLSGANVVQTGGAITPSGPVASNSKDNVAMQRLAQKNQMAQQMIRTVTMLGAAGIHGASLFGAKKAASELTSEASRYATDTRKGIAQAKMFMKHKREHYGADGSLQYSDYWL